MPQIFQRQLPPNCKKPPSKSVPTFKNPPLRKREVIERDKKILFERGESEVPRPEERLHPL